MMARLAFVAVDSRQQPERPSLFDAVSFGGYARSPRPVRPHLRPEPWPLPELPALLIDLRDHPPTARDVSADFAFAISWEAEG